MNKINFFIDISDIMYYNIRGESPQTGGSE
jgi:hypothetical protein